MISPLQPNDYFVEQLTISSNPAFDSAAPLSDRTPGKIHCSVEYSRAIEVPDHFKVAIEVVVEPSTIAPAVDPYSVGLKMQGSFNFLPDSGMTEAQLERMATLNGLSILYGLGRGLVAQSTGVGQFGKYLLPSINFVELLQKKEKVASEEKVSQD